jgi:hypothetical protein
MNDKECINTSMNQRINGSIHQSISNDARIGGRLADSGFGTHIQKEKNSDK